MSLVQQSVTEPSPPTRAIVDPAAAPAREPAAGAGARGAARGDRGRPVRGRRPPDRGPDRDASCRRAAARCARRSASSSTRGSSSPTPTAAPSCSASPTRRCTQVLIPIRLTLERFSFTKALERMARARLRRARQGGLADGRGGARRRPAPLRRGRHPLPRVRALVLRPAAHDPGVAQHRAADPRVLLPLRARRPTSTGSRSSTTQLLEALPLGRPRAC